MAENDRGYSSALCRLPPELLLEIAELATLSDHSSLSRACRYLTHTLQRSLFQRGGPDEKNIYGPMVYGSTHTDSNAILRRALSYGLPQHIDEACSNGQTYLAIAAYNPCSTAVSCLLNHGADADAVGSDGTTLLGRLLPAPPGLHRRVVTYLPRQARRWLPETINRLDGYCDVILQLLEAGETPRLTVGGAQAEDKNVIAAVMRAGNRGYLSDVEVWRLMRALVTKRISLNVVEDFGSTPLAWAVERYCTGGIDFDSIRFLVRNGADTRDRIAFSSESTALSVAIRHGKPNLVRWLLKKGAYPDLSKDNRSDPLSYAISRVNSVNKRKVISTMLDHGVEVNHVSDVLHRRTCRTPLAEAVVSHALGGKGLDIFQMLLEHGADPNVRDNADRTALGEALKLEFFQNKDRPNIVRILLQHGADPNLPYLLRQRHVLPVQAAVYCESWSEGHTYTSDSDSLDDIDTVESERQEIIDLLVEAGGTLLPRNTTYRQHHHLQLALTTQRYMRDFEGQRKDLQHVSDLYECQLRRAGREPGDSPLDLALNLRSVLNTIPLSAWDSIVVARVLRTGVEVSKGVITEIALDLTRRGAYAAMDDEASGLRDDTYFSFEDEYEKRCL